MEELIIDTTGWITVHCDKCGENCQYALGAENHGCFGCFVKKYPNGVPPITEEAAKILRDLKQYKKDAAFWGERENVSGFNDAHEKARKAAARFVEIMGMGHKEYEKIQRDIS